MLGFALLRLGKNAAAVTSFRAALHRDTDTPLAHAWLAVALWRTGDREAAVRAGRAAVMRDPRSVQALSNLCGFLATVGNVDEAVRTCAAAIEIDPDYAWAYSKLGDAHRQRKEYEPAAEAHRKAVDLDPGNATAHWDLAETLRVSGEADDAVAEYRKVLSADPTKYSAYNMLALIALFRGELGPAVAELRRSVAVKRDQTVAHLLLGIALMTQSKFDEAIEEFYVAAEVDNTCAVAYYNLARAKALCADTKGSISALATAFALNGELTTYAGTDGLLDAVRHEPAFRRLLDQDIPVPGDVPAQSGVPVTRAMRATSDAKTVLERLWRIGTKAKDARFQVKWVLDDRINLSRIEKRGQCRFQAPDPNPRWFLFFDHVDVDGVLGLREWYLFDGRWFTSAIERTRQVTEQEICAFGEKPNFFDEGLIPFPTWFDGGIDRVFRAFHVELVGAVGTAEVSRLILIPKGGTRYRRGYDRLELFVDDNSGLPLQAVISQSDGLVIRTASFLNLTAEAIDVGLRSEDFGEPDDWRDFERVIERKHKED